MKLCDTCTYRNNVEQLKPCIIYRDNCEYYEKEGNMTKEQSIKWLKDMLKNFDLPQEQYQTALEMAIKALEQESKTGHWIDHKHNGMAYIECSKCSSWFLRMYLTRNSYCPNCGVKMR